MPRSAPQVASTRRYGLILDFWFLAYVRTSNTDTVQVQHENSPTSGGGGQNALGEPERPVRLDFRNTEVSHSWHTGISQNHRPRSCIRPHRVVCKQLQSVSMFHIVSAESTMRPLQASILQQDPLLACTMSKEGTSSSGHSSMRSFNRPYISVSNMPIAEEVWTNADPLSDYIPMHDSPGPAAGR